MNVGAGIILLIMGAVLLITGCSIFKLNKKAASLILAGATFILCISVLLLTGIYDPYSNHIH
ncbi:hypothetical protein KZX50_08845 [Bacillus infantis]|uniref:hypothetical protein n=1 Tax=Bacillus infantis TaxID=324767 RepID=UPI00200382A2|nr:hypothetical protein [Bacillus infantis]MCK6205557.1 hypothetical protein [Bacillus infantis]